MIYTLIVWSALCTAVQGQEICPTGNYITVARDISAADCERRLSTWFTLGTHQRGACYKVYKT